MWQRVRSATLAVCLAALIAALTAYALSDGIPWWTPDAGGCTSGPGWRMCGAAGQPDAHVTPPYYGGYYGPPATATATDTPTATATATDTPTATAAATSTATPTPPASPTSTTTATPVASGTPPGADVVLPGGTVMRVDRTWDWGDLAIMTFVLVLIATRIIRWVWRAFA